MLFVDWLSNSSYIHRPTGTIPAPNGTTHAIPSLQLQAQPIPVCIAFKQTD